MIETPMVGKRASLTFRLELRATQPITMSIFSGICDAVDGEYCRWVGYVIRYDAIKLLSLLGDLEARR